MNNTPTDDERDRKHAECCGCDLPGCEFMAGWIEREKLTETQGEPSDAQVEAAAQAMFEPDGPGGEYTWTEMVADDPSRADIWREDARKVLRAAGGAR